MKYIAVIGDIIDSKKSENCSKIQENVHDGLSREIINSLLVFYLSDRKAEENLRCAFAAHMQFFIRNQDHIVVRDGPDLI